MQFDFFNDNQSVALRNDVILALEKFDAPAAQQAWKALTGHDPHDAAAVPLLLVIVSLHESTTTPFQSHADLHAACHEMQNKISPAALAGMGTAAANVWLNARWQALATRAAALAYRTEHPNEHAAPLWLQTQQWQAAADAVALIESWRRIPAPLSWMLHARLQLQGLQANWGLLAELAWLAPQRLERVVEQASPSADSCQLTGRTPTTARSKERFTRVEIQVRLRCGMAELAAVLNALESGSPELFIDRLAILSRRKLATSAAPDLALDVSFDLYGYLRLVNEAKS